uniref:Uncharacterized protein n=1 Tax=Caenorhabditis japonica TaxID=281687 RepID=A0A8R1IEE4_CAEJA
MLPLTPATPQTTCSRLKESKCSIGRLAARTSIRLRICGSFSFLVFIEMDHNKKIQGLKTALQREWDAVIVGEPRKLVANMPNRMFEVILKMVEIPAVDNCLLDSIFLINFVFSLQ